MTQPFYAQEPEPGVEVTSGLRMDAHLAANLSEQVLDWTPDPVLRAAERLWRFAQVVRNDGLLTTLDVSLEPYLGPVLGHFLGNGQQQ